MGIFSHNFKKFFVGEPMPDKNDPKYKERYERDVAAGQRFARASGLAWLGRHYCRWAENHKKLFFALMLGSMTFFAAANVYRLILSSQYKLDVMKHKTEVVKDKNL